jgi:hypothetical protein
MDEFVDEAIDVGVGLVSGALSGLTILPASDLLVASYEWIGDQGGVGGTLPLSAPSHTRSGRPVISSPFLVAFGLTDIPLLQSAPALHAGGDFLGGLVGTP